MELLRDYMNEHYAAARNHQMMRLQAMTLYTSASSILFVQAIIHSDRHWVGYTIGMVLILLAALCLHQNVVFHRTNRYHVEIARQARKQITKILGGGKSVAKNDPNLIGEVVRSKNGQKSDDSEFEIALDEAAAGRLCKSNFKVESWIHGSLIAIPFLIGFAGILLIGYLAWLGEIVIYLCSYANLVKS